MALLDDTRRQPSLGLVQVCGAGVLWGSGGLVVTVLHKQSGIGAMTVSAWRMAIAAVALVAFASLTGQLGQVRATVREHPVLAAMIGCGTALYQGFYFLSVLAVGVSVATVVALGLSPVLAAAWEHTVRGTRPPGRQMVVLSAALTGLVLISVSAGQDPPAAGDRPALGLILAVAAGAIYAATTVTGHTLAQRVDSVALTTCATAAGALWLLPFLGIAAIAGDPVATTDPTWWVLLVYLGVATMALAYGLLYAGLRSTTGSAATVATLVEPLFAALLAVLLLNERLTLPAVLGGALVLAAVVALRPTNEHPAPA